MSGAERIAVERQRQMEVEGWDAAHDMQHRDGELALAGAAYAVSATPVGIAYSFHTDALGPKFRDLWPSWWSQGWDKRPGRARGHNRPAKAEAIRALVKAGALIAAEIDRLLAKEAK